METVEAQLRRIQHNQISTWFSTPEVRAAYSKQMQFFSLGKTFEERALFGGNRTGKTLCGCYEDTLHLTGQYPEWWDGIRWQHPVDSWVATDTAKNTRDILQDKLCGKHGDAEAFGTGMIPRELIIRPTVKHGLADAFETVYVRHVPTGGVSSLQFKSYDQGRVAFQGTAQHHIHLDEEPDLEIYAECLMRIMTTNGRLVLTETPLLGVSDLMLQFMPELNPDPEVTKPKDAWEEDRG